MDKYIDKLIKRGLGNIIDKSKDELLFSDKVYQKDSKNEEECEKMYLELDLSRQEKIIINQYIHCIRMSEVRSNELSYIAGVKDAIKFLVAMGLLKSA